MPFRLFAAKDEKTPCEKTKRRKKKTSCEKTKRRKNAMRKDEIRHAKRRDFNAKRRNNAMQKAAISNFNFCCLFAWRLFVCSHDVFLSFRYFVFSPGVISSFRLFAAKRRHVKRRNNARRKDGKTK